MKKIILVLGCILTMHPTIAQITLDGTCYADMFYLIKLEKSGYKYMIHDFSTHIYLYNLNLTLFKQVNLPVEPLNVTHNIAYVSEALFDTDSTDIEFLYQNNNYNTNHTYTDVRDETGSVLLHVDSGSFNSFSTNIYSLDYFFSKLNPNRVRNTPNGAKLYIDIVNSSGWFIRKQIYSLPGYLECSDCLNPNNPALVINDNVMTDDQFQISAFPNPATDFINISYILPEGTKEGFFTLYSPQGEKLFGCKISGNTTFLKLPVSHLSSGIYLYNISTTKGRAESKKIVID